MREAQPRVELVLERRPVDRLAASAGPRGVASLQAWWRYQKPRRPTIDSAEACCMWARCRWTERHQMLHFRAIWDAYLDQKVLEHPVEGAAIIEALQAQLHEVAHRLQGT